MAWVARKWQVAAVALCLVGMAVGVNCARGGAEGENELLVLGLGSSDKKVCVYYTRLHAHTHTHTHTPSTHIRNVMRSCPRRWQLLGLLRRRLGSSIYQCPVDCETSRLCHAVEATCLPSVSVCVRVCFHAFLPASVCLSCLPVSFCSCTRAPFSFPVFFPLARLESRRPSNASIIGSMPRSRRRHAISFSGEAFLYIHVNYTCIRVCMYTE